MQIHKFDNRRMDVLPQDLVKSRMSRDSGSNISNHSEIWQAPRQSCCRDACQISERYDRYNIQSRGFETSRDLAVRGPGFFISPVWFRHSEAVRRLQVSNSFWPQQCWTKSGRSGVLFRSVGVRFGCGFQEPRGCEGVLEDAESDQYRWWRMGN